MIQGTQGTDRIIEHHGLWRRLAARKGLWGLAALLLAGALVAYPSVQRWARTDRSIDASRLRLATVTRGDLVRDVTVEGRIVAAFHPTLYSPAAGHVELLVQPGEPVGEGQVLARVESPELESRLDQERSSASSLDSQLERQRLAARQLELENTQQNDLLQVRAEAAERAMARAQRTFDEGVVGAADYERAKDDLAIARLELAHALRKGTLDSERVAFEVRQHELAVERGRLVVGELERQVGKLDVRSPVAGLASRLMVEDRDAVAAGQPLVAVVDLSAFEVEVAVPEAYADEAGIGTPVMITAGGQRYQGTVRRMAPEVEGGVVEGSVAFTGGTPEGLKQSQRVQARLVLGARRDVLKVARGPFLESDGGRLAWVVAGGVARPRPIETGSLSVAEVEIVTGLDFGDTIIVSGTARFAGAESLLIRQ